MTDDEIRETIEILREPDADLNFAMTAAEAVAVLEELLRLREERKETRDV